MEGSIFRIVAIIVIAICIGLIYLVDKKKKNKLELAMQRGAGIIAVVMLLTVNLPVLATLYEEIVNNNNEGNIAYYYDEEIEEELEPEIEIIDVDYEIICDEAEKVKDEDSYKSEVEEDEKEEKYEEVSELGGYIPIMPANSIAPLNRVVIDSGIAGIVPWELDNQSTLWFGAGTFPTTHFNAGWRAQGVTRIVFTDDVDTGYRLQLFTSMPLIEIENIDRLDISNITDMSFMFANMTHLTSLDVSHWDLSNVTNMDRMFQTNTGLVHLDVSNWNVSNVTNMTHMFIGASSLMHLDVSSWDVSNVTDMGAMFSGATSLTSLDVSSWDVSNVIHMGSMFNGMTLENLALSTWDVSNATNMSFMFADMANLTSLEVSSWDVSNVTNMSNMFRGLTIENLDLFTWDVSNVINMSGMFNGLTVEDLEVSSWDVSNVTNMSFMFANMPNLTNLEVSSWDVSNVTNTSNMFRELELEELDLSTWDVSNVTNMSFMFENMSNLTNLDVSNWDVSSVTNVNSMFNGLTVEELDLSTWDVSNVTNVSNMNGMFNGLTVENLDIFHWDISNVTNITASTNIGSIFRGLAIENLDLSNWDVSNVTNMSNMFRGASGPTRIGNLDLSNWDVSNVTNMSNMFRGASGIRNLDVSSWDVSNVTNMSEMFRGASSLESLDLSNWDTNSLSSSGMRDIFNGVYSLRKLVLGQNFQFHETTSSSSSLPIGIWQNVGTGTINNPNGQHRLTSQELMNTFNGATMADIFVWRPSVVIRVTEEIMPGNCSMGWCWGVTSAPDSLWFDIEETLHGAFSGRVYMTHDQTAQGIRSHHIDIIIELEIEYDGQEFIFSVVDTPLFDIEWHWYESSSGGWNARRNTNMFSDIRIVTRQEGNGFVIDRRYVRDITFNWDRHWMEGEDFLIYGDWQQETWPEPPLTALIYEPTEEPHGLSYGVTLRLLDEEGELLRRTGSAFEIVDLNRPTLWGTGEANLPTRKPSYNECLSGSSSMHMLFYVVLRRRISRDWMDDRNV